MERNFTKTLKCLFAILLGIATSGSLIAQVTHQVTVQGMSFTPSTLEINEGDIVEWNNIDGYHSIDGTLSSFPDNTESFGNGAASSPWTYSYTFNSAGTNEYQCGIHNTMMGFITVLPVFDCPELEADFGEPCDDTDPNTENDEITLNCECAGTLIYCPDLDVNSGDDCDDLNVYTENDVVTPDCECVGTAIYCPEFDANAGEFCDDGDPDTFNDIIDENCDCAGFLLAPNDEACDASDLICGEEMLSTSIGATQSMDPVLCGGFAAEAPVEDVWFAFTADGESSYSVETNTGFDAIIVLYNDNCEEPEYLTCADNTVDEDPEILNTGQLGAGDYLVRIYAYDGEDEFFITLECFDTPDTPPNDEACGAIALSCGESLESSTTSSTQSLEPVLCGGFTAEAPVEDVWFSFTADGSSTYSISTSIGFDAIISLYDGECEDPVYITCDDNTVNGAPETLNTQVLDAGNYFVRVYRYSGDGDFTISLSCGEAPDNDDACSAISLVCGEALETTSNFATQSIDPLECNEFMPNAPVEDVWFEFTADGASAYSIQISSGFDAVIGLYNDECLDPLYLNCADNTSDEDPEVLDAGELEAGNYLVRIYRYNNSDDFSITLMCSLVGLDELSKEEQVIGIFGETIRVLAPEKVERVSIFSMTGKEVQNNSGSKAEINIDNSIASGIYIAVAYDYSGNAVQYIKLFND